MTTFDRFLTESKKDFSAEFRKSMKKDIRAIEAAMSKIDEAITKLSAAGSAAKSNFRSLDSIKGKAISNTETPKEYNASVGIENFSSAHSLRREVKLLRQWLEVLKQI